MFLVIDSSGQFPISHPGMHCTCDGIASATANVDDAISLGEMGDRGVSGWGLA